MLDITLIHPKVVHFPIAFLLAAFVFDIWGMIKKDEFYYRVGWINLVLAFLFSIVTVITGLLAANNVPHNDLAHQTMETHENLGYVIGGALLILFIWRWRLKGNFPQKGKPIYVLLLLFTTVTIVISGDLGGKMVYEYGVAVKAVPQEEAGEHSHNGNGGHSHGESNTSEGHDHGGAADESHEHGEMPDHAADTTHHEMNTQNNDSQTSKNVHTHEDGTVHEH